MTPEYVDRKALLNNRPEGRNPGQVGKEEYNKGWNDCRSAFYKCIEEEPIIDVKPVVHAKWIQKDSRNPFSWRACSECGHAVTAAMARVYKGCPICLARMDGVSNA